MSRPEESEPEAESSEAEDSKELARVPEAEEAPIDRNVTRPVNAALPDEDE